MTWRNSFTNRLRQERFTPVFQVRGINRIFNSRAGGNLSARRDDSGVTALSFMQEHPGKFCVDVELGTVDDPWLVCGWARVLDGGVVAWPDSPAAALFCAALSQ